MARQTHEEARCIINFPGGFFHVLSQESKQKQNRSGKKTSFVPPTRLKHLNNPVGATLSKLRLQVLKGSKRSETCTRVSWDIKCKHCTTFTVQTKNYSRAVIITVSQLTDLTR